MRTASALKRTVALAVASIVGCASYPTQDDVHALSKSAMRCGPLRLGEPLKYGTLPFKAEVYSANTSTPRGEASLEAAKTLSESVQEVLGTMQRSRAPEPHPFGDEIVSRNNLRYFLPRDSLGSEDDSPCTQHLDLTTADRRAPLDILVFGRAENREGVTGGEIAQGALLALLVVIMAAGGAAPSSGSSGHSPMIEPGYIVLAGADARSGQVLWVRTRFLQASDSLLRKADVTRLVQEALTDK